MNRTDKGPWVAGACALVLAGCVDSNQVFDDFTARQAAAADAMRDDEPDAGQGDSGNDGPCELPEPGEVEGLFVLSVSTPLAPTKPVIQLVRTTAEMEGDVLVMSLSTINLAADDRMRQVGEWTEPRRFELTEPVFESEPFESVTHPEGNPVLLNTETTSEISLAGELCSVRTDEDPEAVIEFWCGDVNGMVTKPLTMPLDGATFAATRVPDEETIPTEFKINCAGDLAEPL